MQPLLIVSSRPGSGKTTLAAAIAEVLKRDGLSTAYFKALETGNGTAAASGDARFMASLLGQQEAAAGAVLGHADVSKVLAGGERPAGSVVVGATNAGAGKDLLIVEGPDTLTQGESLGLSARQLSDALNARVIVTARYGGDDVVDELLPARAIIGNALLGVVITAVPTVRMSGAAERLGGFLARHGITLLGVLPYDERLAAVTVRQLAEHLGGEIMNNDAQADALIENYMVGTVVLGKASEYFKRKDKKAVIAHGSRPDMHLAALETDTRCIVLAGNVIPNPIVVARAEEQEVPLVMVKQDTLAVLEQIEELYPVGRFAQRGNVPLVADAALKNLDLSAVRVAAGAAS